ncbi:MAG: hypothetical protein Ct9H300mP9_5720 [Candidatus Neomarinimicrobiota bacterium]|nr:MAG: hypothetical protein Ct9H300mP9_5720 [Candidatus Neomarinimicrobiota bacterium]
MEIMLLWGETKKDGSGYISTYGSSGKRTSLILQIGPGMVASLYDVIKNFSGTKKLTQSLKHLKTMEIFRVLKRKKGNNDLVA